MSQKAIPLSLAFRVCVFFACNPEEELTSADIVDKFGVEGGSVHRCLSTCVRLGLIERVSTGPGRGKLVIYRAGVRLRQMVGAAVPDNVEIAMTIIAACSPVPFAYPPTGNLTTGAV